MILFEAARIFSTHQVFQLLHEFYLMSAMIKNSWSFEFNATFDQRLHSVVHLLRTRLQYQEHVLLY